MALSAVPFALQNGSHPAVLFRQAASSFVPNTGGIVQAGDLNVAQTGTPSMAVTVGVGRAWVPGTNVANFTGTTYSSQAQYFALNDAAVTLTIAAADPTNPRIDVVCLTVNDAFYSGSTNNAVLQVITGAPAASPTAPTAPANSLVLANVAVAANTTSIVTANITLNAPAATKPFGHMGRTGGFQALTTSASTVTMSAAQTLRGGMTFSSAANGLIVPVAGLYRLTLKAYFSGGATTYIADALKNNTNTGAEVRVAITSTDLVAGASVTVPCAVNDQLTVGAYTLASGSNNVWGTDGYNGIYLEAEYVGA